MTAPTTPPPGNTEPPEQPAPAGPPARTYTDDKIPRGLWIRVVLYVVATHVLLALMSLVVLALKYR